MPIVGFLLILLLAASVYVAAERRRATREAVAAAIPLEAPRASWTMAILGDAVQIDVRERLAIVERLGIVGSTWAIAVLEAALADEPEAQARAAIWRTLIALRTDEATSS